MKYFNKIEELFIMLVIAVMGLVLGLQVFTRYVLNHPLVWSEELARYLFVWLTFIGASYGVRNNIHISMELVFAKMPRPIKLLLHTFTNLFAAAVFFYLIPSGMEFVEDQSYIASSAMQIPMSWVFISIPIGCGLMGLRLVAQTIANIRTKGANL